jgi:hypothetical protein
VRFANLIAMCPTEIARRGVETSWASLVTPFLIEQSLEFPQLGGVFLQLFWETRICLSESCHNTSVRCGCCCQICQCSNGGLGNLILIVSHGGIYRVVSGCGSGFSLHLLVLTVSGCKVGFELRPSFFSGWFLVPPTIGAQELACCKYFCISNVHLLRVTDEDAPLLQSSQHNLESA